MAARPKKYLVTGGCGFIGSHLADALIARGHQVVILDDLSTGKKEYAHPKATLIIGDATDCGDIDYAFYDIDGCFHLAAIASVEKSRQEWARAHMVNINATINVFQAASQAKRKIPVVYASSAAVYGDCPVIPVPEHAPASPLTAYGADKLSCDIHARAAWQVYGLPTIGLRPFNVYGPRQNGASPYSGVISIFASRMDEGKPMTIYGDGNQVRDFVYIEDAVRGFVAAMDSLQNSQYPVQHEIINLCTGRGTSINQLADIMERLRGFQQPRDYLPARKGDINISIGNPSYLASFLGLKLEIPLETGLRLLMAELAGV